jgi:hypothetical protein
MVEDSKQLASKSSVKTDRPYFFATMMGLFRWGGSYSLAEQATPHVPENGKSNSLFTRITEFLWQKSPFSEFANVRKDYHDALKSADVSIARHEKQMKSVKEQRELNDKILESSNNLVK